MSPSTAGAFTTKQTNSRIEEYQIYLLDLALCSCQIFSNILSYPTIYKRVSSCSSLLPSDAFHRYRATGGGGQKTCHQRRSTCVQKTSPMPCNERMCACAKNVSPMSRNMCPNSEDVSLMSFKACPDLEEVSRMPHMGVRFQKASRRRRATCFRIQKACHPRRARSVRLQNACDRRSVASAWVQKKCLQCLSYFP